MSLSARDVIVAFPSIERWVSGGHSLGGVMAARFAGRDQPRGTAFARSCRPIAPYARRWKVNKIRARLSAE
ncbi:MAG: hypothetical protein OXI30_11010 [Chloroflexota bacterium]|nr:hypothetical protein [Chloroflexota bacterium]